MVISRGKNFKISNVVSNQTCKTLILLKSTENLLKDISMNHACVVQLLSTRFHSIFFRRTSPAVPIVFQFDQALIEDTLGNKLQPNSLTVDNLTVDWLRSRLTDLESLIKECQDKQTKVITDGNGVIKPPSPLLNGGTTTGTIVNGTGKDVK